VQRLAASASVGLRQVTLAEIKRERWSEESASRI